MKSGALPGCGGCAVLDQSQDRCQDAEVFVSSKVCSHQAPFRPNLDAFVGIIDAILAADKELPKKQRHTVKRIFERLRDEQGFKGGMTIVKEFVAGWRQRTQERFVPLVHPPGYAHVDFGEALDVIGGIDRKIHFLAMDLSHPDAIFVVGYPAGRRKPFAMAT